ncbi:MAG: S-layer homology domain-containing protein [Clostridiales bacterium]|nr:S-layer homology domain-containing protein [Clostridiales bacterium]
MKSLKKTLVLLVVLSMILSAVSPVFAFNDVIAEEYAEQANKMAAFGVFAGDADGNFNADAEITRAEMAVIIGKLMGLTENEANANKVYNSNFSDVVAGDWYTGWVNLVAGRGIISGFPDGTFRPNEKVTQAQAVTMIVKALGWGVVVDQTGTWPANYITKASELRLFKDAVDTNSELVTRGNVAIYCYNALTAKTWDVAESTDGQLTSKKSTDTILAKYFSDFVNEDGKMKLVESIEVKETGATTLEIGVNQIKLDGTTAGFDTKDTLADFLGGLKSYPKNRDEKTYGTANDVVAYVTEGTANIANLAGRKVDVIFGKDNEVVYVAVTNDAVENAFVEEYNSTTKVITIAGEEYEFKSGAEVYVNGVKFAAEAGMTAVLNNLNETTEKEFTKKVGANFTLDVDGDIERLDLSVSGTYSDFHTIEAVVSKNNSETLTYYYQNGTNWTKDSYDYEDELDDDKLPRVTIDGEVADITDIEAGNVVTMVYGTDKDEVQIIKVATTPVEGEVTRLQSKANKIYVDGTAYVASMGKFTVTNEDIKDGEAGTWGTTVVKEDEVKLYVNVYGEYVLVATEEANSSEWNFAYVRSIKSVDENDNDQLVAELRLLLPDGTKSSAYSIVVDIDEYDAATGETKIETFEKFVDSLEKSVIAYKVNSDNEIVLESSKVADIKEDLLVIVGDNTDIKEATKVGSDYEVKTLAKDEKADDKRDTIGAYYFENDTVIFDTKEEEILTRWSSIISSDKLVAGATVIVDGDELKYMFFTTDLTTISDELYAIYQEVDSEEVTLVNGDGSLVLEHADKEATIAAIAENAFVEYTVNSKNEVNAMTQLIDVKEFNTTDGKIDVKEGTFAKLFIANMLTLANGEKDAFAVEKVGKLSFTYVDGTKADDGFDTLGTVKVDEDAVVYDLRNGGFEVADYDYFVETVTEEDIYVIPFFNAEAEGYDKDATPVKAEAANILVIVK